MQRNLGEVFVLLHFKQNGMKFNNSIYWVLRVLIAGLFIFSSFSKLPPMSPIEAFEKQLVDLGFVNWDFAPLFARSIIAFELFLGLAFLQNHFFKKLIIPAMVGMLLIFIIHLSYQIALHGNEGNCGCMGQVIKMTPLEAILKNIITIALIVIIYRKTPPNKNSKLVIPSALFIIVGLFMFLVYPIKSAAVENPFNGEVKEDPSVPTDSAELDSSQTETKSASIKEQDQHKGKDTLAKVKEEPKPKRVNSEFTSYTNFNGKKVNLNQGKKIVCVFNTTCDHCMGIAKKMTAAAAKAKLPPIYILFWTENDAKGEDLQKEIDAFFKFSGSSHPYTMIEVMTFFKLLGKHSGPPRIAVMNEGNIMGDFSEDNFSEEAFLKACEK